MRKNALQIVISLTIMIPIRNRKQNPYINRKNLWYFSNKRTLEG